MTDKIYTEDDIRAWEYGVGVVLTGTDNMIHFVLFPEKASEEDLEALLDELGTDEQFLEDLGDNDFDLIELTGDILDTIKERILVSNIQPII